VDHNVRILFNATQLSLRWASLFVAIIVQFKSQIFLIQIASLWNNGIYSFNDPIPPGNTIYHVQLEYLGRYYCDPLQPKTSFVALLNGTLPPFFKLILLDELLASSRFDMNPSGCGCDLGCGAIATFQSNDEIIDYSTYHYGQQNTIQTWLITNDICVSYINVTFYYKPCTLRVINFSHCG
jgi:hypothetical protein